MKTMCISLAVVCAGFAAVSAEEVTYSRDVAPILHKHCVSCHRPGEVGPFALLTYRDAAKRAKFIKEVTASRQMPPWKAEPQEHAFVDERRLSDQELSVLARWVAAGAPEGDPKQLPSLPKFTEGWQLGQPDLVLKMRKKFTLPAGGRDVYQWFTIPIDLKEDRTVAAVEFRPGNRRVVHHALLYLDGSGEGRRKDSEGDGFRALGGPGFVPTGGFGAWVPGLAPRFLPEGVGMRLPKGCDLVLQIHYHPSGKEEQDQSQVGVYFTKKPAERLVAGVTAVNMAFHIPAGDKRHHVTASAAPLPVDVQATGIFPHMHLLGREMKAVAELPGGGSIPLLHIKDWDFNWQNTYLYARPFLLPKGTVVKIDAWFDNSADNPQNPNRPPKPARWGEQTTDEMCLLAVQVTADRPEDLAQISRMRGNRLGAALVGGISSRGPADDSVDNLDARKIVPADGFPIPAVYLGLVKRYDANNDGKLSVAEVEAMPASLRERVLRFIQAQKKEMK